MPQFHINKYFGTCPLRFNDFLLIQIGRLYFSARDEIKAHTHGDFYELTIITDGEGHIITNGTKTPVKRGSIYLSKPYDTHEIHSLGAVPMKFDFFSFYTEQREFLDALSEIAKKLGPADRVFSDERIGSLVCDAIMEFMKEESYSREILYSIFTQIVIYIIRDFESGSVGARVRNASEADTVCYRIMNYIDTHIYTMSSLDELTEVMKYNYSYLSTLFKKNTGNTLLSYFRKKRLEAAKALILEGAMNISDIAAALNYSSLYSFSRAFKDMYGISPKQFSKDSPK